MSPIALYKTPADLRDFPDGHHFYQEWHDDLEGRIRASTPGAVGGEFFDASEIDVDVIGERRLVWMALPREQFMPNRDNRAIAFNASEARDNQNEYCEWHVEKKGRKISKVTFVTETPEYWELMWEVDRGRVIELYRELTGFDGTAEDLMSNGNYNKRNAWNTDKGIIHLIQQINTLNDAIGLSQGAATRNDKSDNYEVPSIRGTSVDPRVDVDVGTLVRKDLSVTLADPIGLYISGWDDTGFSKPDGQPVGNYWKIVRGQPGRVLRLVYEVPSSEGFLVGDILIGGRRIEYGSQLAEHVSVMIGGSAGTRIENLRVARA